MDQMCVLPQYVHIKSGVSALGRVSVRSMISKPAEYYFKKLQTQKKYINVIKHLDTIAMLQ